MTTTDAALAALRAKLAGPDPRDGVTLINLIHQTRDVQTWALKRDADAALRTLRARGLNVDKGIRVQRARLNPVAPSVYVVTCLGQFGETILMTEDGSWVPGRLLAEQPGTGAIWMPYESAERGETIPASFTHVTRTAPYFARAERYRTKSNGSCGRYVRNDDSVALCTCGWNRLEDTRAEAQAAARVHRFEVAA